MTDYGLAISLLEKRKALELRLEDGYRRIDEAQAQGKDVDNWETFWISLLREYETVCDSMVEFERSTR